MKIINKNDIEPTILPDGFGLRTTPNKEVVIIDFISSNPVGEQAVISSIALPKTIAKDLMSQIQKMLKDN